MIFDIGANVGHSVAAFRSAFPESDVYAFEPSPTAFSKLQDRIGKDPRVKLVQEAVGEHDGTATLHQNVADDSNSMLVNSSRLYEFAPIEMCEPVGDLTVPITRIDSFCAKHSISQIDLLIDSPTIGANLDRQRRLLDPPPFGLSRILASISGRPKLVWRGHGTDAVTQLRLFGITNVAYDGQRLEMGRCAVLDNKHRAG